MDGLWRQTEYRGRCLAHCHHHVDQCFTIAAWTQRVPWPQTVSKDQAIQHYQCGEPLAHCSSVRQSKQSSSGVSRRSAVLAAGAGSLGLRGGQAGLKVLADFRAPYELSIGWLGCYLQVKIAGLDFDHRGL